MAMQQSLHIIKDIKTANCHPNSSYSIMGANIKLFNDKYCIDERNVYATWRGMHEKNEDVIRVCMQVKEQVDMMG